MTHILHITASIRNDDSVSNNLGSALVEKLSAQEAATVTRRNLAANDLPYQSWERFNAGLTSPDERSPEQSELAALADTLIGELQAPTQS